MNNYISNINNQLNQIEDWLIQHNFKIITKDVNKHPNLTYNLFIQRTNEKRYQFNISLFKDKPFFLFNVKLKFSQGDHNALKSFEKKDKKNSEQLFMDLRKITYSLNIDIELKLPLIQLTRELTLEYAKNEQFFIDEVHNFLHAIELIRIRFDEFFYAMFPKGRPKNTHGI